MIEKMNAQLAAAAAPVKALAELNLSVAEKLVASYVEGVQKYSAVALDNAKAALEVADLEAARELVLSQGDVAKQVYADLVADAESVVEIEKAYVNDVQQLVTSNVETMLKRAA